MAFFLVKRKELSRDVSADPLCKESSPKTSSNRKVYIASNFKCNTLCSPSCICSIRIDDDVGSGLPCLLNLKDKVVNYIRFKHGRLLFAIISSSPSFPSFQPEKEARVKSAERLVQKCVAGEPERRHLAPERVLWNLVNIFCILSIFHGTQGSEGKILFILVWTLYRHVLCYNYRGCQNMNDLTMCIYLQSLFLRKQYNEGYDP